jgi:hypothetical protein
MGTVADYIRPDLLWRLRGVIMGTVADYRRQAEECRELATLLHRAANKNILERLAQTWETLAELRERLEIEPKVPTTCHSPHASLRRRHRRRGCRQRRRRH